MITRLLQRFVGELVCSSRDGSVSLSRLAAVTAHFLAAIFFVYHNLQTGYNEALWIIYLGFATGHAVYDKTLMLTKGGKSAATPAEPSE
ncbi:hypothetical protein HPT27_10635 [Permianibacter sp. IMCC34836]|uniref:hypothetical protein n=1 Tax=Permianibacter fluminis TaxID=2738515 RepID=UPI001553188A|nr:hypothetical protein [Permianibacter fluminis]NQD37484.1 hypothetical protein [Permianibacter fluminis]